VLLVFGAPCQLRLLAGQEYDRTIPLTDIRLSRIVSTFVLGVPDDQYGVGPPSFRIASEISWDLS
jgi:hypothetical protein